MRRTEAARRARVVAIAVVATPFAQEKIDHDIEWKIRREATEQLADHAARCTSSPTSTARA